jgi:hypothetical protein
MKKILLTLALIVVVYFTARPYVAVSLDEWGFAVIGRTSVHHKFEPWFTFPAPAE